MNVPYNTDLTPYRVFAIRWLPQSPRKALPVLVLQVAAALAAMAPVFLLHW